MKRSILGLIVAAVTMGGPLFAQSNPPEATSPSTNTAPQRTDDHHNYGWIGLVGLAGLAGLTKKNDRREHSVHTPSTVR